MKSKTHIRRRNITNEASAKIQSSVKSSIKTKKRKLLPSSGTTNGTNNNRYVVELVYLRNTLVSIILVLLLTGISIMYYENSPFRRFFQLDKKKDSRGGDTSKLQHEVLHPQVPEWNMSDPLLQRVHDFLTNYVCTARGAYCHPLLYPVPQRRTHRAAETSSNHSIKSNDLVMILPRNLLIWDLDAMRDTWIRDNLFLARHDITGNALDSGAFLAAFLVRIKLLGLGIWKGGNDGLGALYDNEQKIMEFLNILPSYHEMQDEMSTHSHPVVWNEEELYSFFGKLTPSFRLLKGYRNMIHSEYLAFCKTSAEFKQYVTEKEYTAMRLNVISRSFGPGPPSREEEKNGIFGTNSLMEELQLYKKEAGVDLTKGSRAMSPILDMWDHHAKPNVEWKYDNLQRAFIIRAIDRIPPMQDIMVSYGKYTDTHLFAKFGFVNGDGSGYTEASIAIMHPLLDIGMGQQFTYLVDFRNGTKITTDYDYEAQKRALVNYLRYDDGYDYCVTKENNPKGYRLKILKLRHLQKIANDYDRWTFRIAPRNERSKPSMSSEIPISTKVPQFDSRSIKFDGSKIISTCRLIALTEGDFDGKAIEKLEKELVNQNLFIEKQTDQLELRALAVLSRLTTGALHLYPSNTQSDISALSFSSLKFGSKEWTATQVRLGEMLSLEVVRSIASSGVKQMRNRVQQSIPASHSSLNIRNRKCPEDSTLKLLKEVSYSLR